MTSTPRETERHDVDLSRKQRWVVHHVVVSRADEAIDAGTRPAEWLVDLFERIEAGRSTITGRQATELQSALETYLGDEETPDTDRSAAEAVLGELTALDR